jgi:hypothetical protein
MEFLRMLLFFVIASVAKQSMPPQAAKWIASSLALLAMTVASSVPLKGSHSGAMRSIEPEMKESRRAYTPPG